MNVVSDAGVDLPRHELIRLAVVATGLGRTDVLRMDTFDDSSAAVFAELCARRLAGEPLQYIEGAVQFGPIEIAVDRRVLIPRPETERLWELAVQLAPGAVRVVDLCTGSGALALALAHALPNAEVHGTDLSPDAVDVARENAHRLGLDVSFHIGDLWNAVPQHLRRAVDLLVANPPYVASSDLVTLEEEVRAHEPEMALLGGDDGLDLVERILHGLDTWLSPDGLGLIEIGADQGAEAMARVPTTLHGSLEQDLVGRDRYVVLRRA